MKPEATPQIESERSPRVEFQIRFSTGPKGQRRVREAPTEAPPPQAVKSAPAQVVVASPERVPQITRLLVLAHHFERLVREGTVRDYAEIARLTGLTRARVTQIVGLTLLSPEIQDAVFSLPQGSHPTERRLRPLTTQSDWRSQHGLWKSLVRSLADR